jgi:hypothetical protein
VQAVAAEQEVIRGQVEEVRKIAATLDPSQGNNKNRMRRYKRLQKRLEKSGDPARMQMAVMMAAFMVGVFAGGDLSGLPVDNLELERWFRKPKGHARRIHGHSHAGVRIVQEGATLALVLDAHSSHEGPFTGEELMAYREAQPPPDEQEALRRRKVMRKARSKKKRPRLLAELEQRYLDAS